ncbi:RNA polymerase II C-terminal domain phosphatase-like 3 [Silene latifolia]|uniref:RNA polymerase II C-terminal domain phosphatase-like 3 n=1 Tax=Silene latifolia TaxID=37657 RepID=UPI003D782AF5
MGSNGGGGGVENGELTPPEATNNNNNNSNNNSNKNSYWMKDMYKYSYPRGYGGASGLYNIAWAQAVQNKPLNDVLVELDNTKDKNNKIDDEKIDSDMEEGELEEGEIDGEFEDGEDSNNKDNNTKGGGKKEEIEDGELEIQVSSIRKVLDNVTAVEANKSFDIVCARLRSSLESLKELVLHTWFPSKDDLIQQSFSAFLCVYSVFSHMNPTVRDQNRDKMSRLLTFVMSLSSILFTLDQRKEVEAMIASVNPPSPPKPKSMDRQEELPINNDKAIITDSITASVINGDSCSDFSERVGLDSPIHQSDKLNSDVLGNAMNQFQANLKAKGGGFSLLLDLHKVHDEDSLPSPTSKTAPTFPYFGSGAPPKISHGLHNSAMHPYETQAMKAMSSYQQKFGASSFMTPDRLPSPTPSEDGNEEGVDVSNGEVNSFGNNSNVKNAIHPMLTQPSTSSAIASILPANQELVSGISAGTSNVGINPASRISGKSRDPRLRRLSSNSSSIDLSFCPSPLLPVSAPKLESLGEKMNPKKKPEGPVVDSPALKRHKSGLETTYMSTNVNEVQTVRGSIGSYASSFLGPPTDPRKSVGITVSPGISSISTSGPIGTISQPVNNGSYMNPLQSLLNGLSGNPAALVNILKEQQKINEPLPKVSESANSNSVQVQVSLPTTSSTMSSGVGPLQTCSPPLITATSPQEDPGKHRMKPRDPRRVLQSNATQKTGNNKVNGLLNVTNQGVKDNFNTNSTSSFSTPDLPDIAKQFTKNLKNIADIITSCETSRVLTSPSIGSQSLTVNLDKASVNSALVRTVDHHSGSALKPEEAVASRPPSQNHWGDVEHLFEGYDTQERAAIQQERVRRMDEQKQMFDSRKLCLVLDLDHTLLNSAKFVEVDPRHDEILRKKEEHDREKPKRHLFRFPRMGMWTKLRPGVWNFLEKASKLYELHLYTMGNKLYATEMAKLLDPNGNLFAGRVISRGDDGESSDGDDRVFKTKDLDGVLGMESSVVIIDDSVRVWPHNKLNLIVVERYLYFPCSRRQFGLSGPSLLDCDRDERPEDGTLACCLGVIERLHKNFFANKSLDDVDVRNILASEQRSILAGCRILFSRVFPVGESSPHLYPLWQTAEQFGAVCTNQIDEQVTHVVANAPGTDKVNWALSTGRFVVHPSWVEASAVLYRRAREHDFAIKP